MIPKSGNRYSDKIMRTQPLKVGVAGLGTVGASLVAQIARQRDALSARCGRVIDVVAVCARSRAKNRGVDLRKMKWFSDPAALAREPGIDVFVELIGGAGDPARNAVQAALVSGKSVVTANKALLAKHGIPLAALAERNHVALNFEAAVGGAIPIVKTLREGMAGNSFERIYGILNGTCNYILTRMEQEKMPFAECLKEAQRLGYAEADPSFDIEGHDTAQKLAILASLAFGIKADQRAIYVEGISSITPADLFAAEELGYRVKLLGVAVKTQKGIEQRVHPTMVRKDSAIAQVMGVTNAVTIDAADINPLTLVGPGAGGAATASAVLLTLATLRAVCVLRRLDGPQRGSQACVKRRCSGMRGATTYAWSRGTSRELPRRSLSDLRNRRFHWSRLFSATIRRTSAATSKRAPSRLFLSLMQPAKMPYARHLRR